MRILTVANTPLVKSSGSGYVILNYAARLRQRGHHVNLRGPSDFELLHGHTQGIRYRQALGMAVRIPRWLAGGNYDVLETFGAEAWLNNWLLRQRPGRRFLMVAHSNGIETHAIECERRYESERSWYQLDLSRFFAAGFRAVDAIVTVSQWDRDFAIDRGYASPDRILAIENPLSSDYLGQDLTTPRLKTIGFVGSWLPRKGIDILPTALTAVLRAHPEWRLGLVGVGTAFHGSDWFPPDVLERIEVIPYIERDELRTWYRSVAMLVVPSRYESFGLVAAESMACGAALVASRVGLAASLCHREEAYLLDELTAESLRSAVDALIQQPSLREAIARGGYRRVQSLRWDDAALALESAYERWLAEVRRSESSSATGAAGGIS